MEVVAYLENVRSRWGHACGLDGEYEVVLALPQVQVFLPPVLKKQPPHLPTQPDGSNV